jgi:uncharacterized RDD family membrane protein YckC
MVTVLMVAPAGHSQMVESSYLELDGEVPGAFRGNVRYTSVEGKLGVKVKVRESSSEVRLGFASYDQDNFWSIIFTGPALSDVEGRYFELDCHPYEDDKPVTLKIRYSDSGAYSRDYTCCTHLKGWIEIDKLRPGDRTQPDQPIELQGRFDIQCLSWLIPNQPARATSLWGEFYCRYEFTQEKLEEQQEKERKEKRAAQGLLVLRREEIARSTFQLCILGALGLVALVFWVFTGVKILGLIKQKKLYRVATPTGAVTNTALSPADYGRAGRRLLAHLIDGILLWWIWLPFQPWLLKYAINERTAWPFAVINLITIAVSVSCLMILGGTPGKLMTGLRVVSSDFRYLALGPALVRSYSLIGAACLSWLQMLLAVNQARSIPEAYTYLEITGELARYSGIFPVLILTLGLVYLIESCWLVSDPDNQAGHDKLAGSYVVDERALDRVTADMAPAEVSEALPEAAEPLLDASEEQPGAAEPLPPDVSDDQSGAAEPLPYYLSEALIDADPVGVGGWLILPIIHLFLNAILLTFETLHLLDRFSFTGLFQLQYWELVSYYMNFRFLIVAGLLFASIRLIQLIFNKKARLPRMMIYYYSCLLAFSFADLAIFSSTRSIDPDIASIIAGQLIGQCLFSCIWILYFAISQRVKNTFVE